MKIFLPYTWDEMQNQTLAFFKPLTPSLSTRTIPGPLSLTASLHLPSPISLHLSSPDLSHRHNARSSPFIWCNDYIAAHRMEVEI